MFIPEAGEKQSPLYGLYMYYKKEEKLNLEKKVFITKEVYDILREQKRKQKISMAKIVCNLIINKYGKINLK